VTQEDDDYSYGRLDVFLATPGGRYPTDEDEERAVALGGAIDQAIDEADLGSVCEINGIEFGPGGVTILLFGGHSDEHVPAIYAVVAPLFRASACERGSYLVRRYGAGDGGREEISDRVT